MYDVAETDELTTEALAQRLTVVLLTHNCAHRLDRVLDQLATLQLPIIAVDNASTDDTVAVLARRPSIEVVRLPQNVGAAGRNAGVERCRTPYVVFVDDDGWYERDALDYVCELMDHNAKLALVNARIAVGDEQRLDPISAEMAASPLRDTDGLPGTVLLSYMAGAVIFRVDAYRQAGGYDPRFFIGGEEETLAFKLAKLGWQMRYVPEVVMHHHPSRANDSKLRSYGMRNTLWNAWLHRRLGSALRWTWFTLADTPKNRDWLRGLGMTARGLGWVLAERDPMPSGLDRQVSELDKRRFANRRAILTFRERTPEDPGPWGPPS